jgi:bla regulator protein BlaR1
MSAVFEFVAWNSLVALSLAGIVLVASRVWKYPELLHVLWLVVLIKLITPGMIRLAALPDIFGSTMAPSEMPPAWASPVVADAAALPAVFETANPIRWASLPVIAWVGGSTLFVILIGLQWLRFARVMRTASPAGSTLAHRVSMLAQRIGVSPPRTLMLDAPVSPMVWSTLRRSTLILPSRLLERLTAEQTDTLLTHELAHVKRRDPWIRWIELGVTAALWWNPLVWWVRRRLRQAEEQACDRRVLDMFPRGQRAYADGIVKTVEFLAGHGRTPQFATGATGTRHIKERLTMILNPSSKRRFRHPLVPALLLALLVLPVVPGFAEREDRNAEETRAELLELQREALELERRLVLIQAEKNALEMSLGETRQGMQRAEMQDREQQMRDRELEMREARSAYEQAREQGDRSVAEHYEQALAEFEQNHAQRAEAHEHARQMQRRELGNRQQNEIAQKLDAMAQKHEQLRDADRSVEAEELELEMEKLQGEMIEREYDLEREVGRRTIAGHELRIQLEEMSEVVERTEDDAEREELRRAIELLTRKLRELEHEKRRSGAF